MNLKTAHIHPQSDIALNLDTTPKSAMVNRFNDSAEFVPVAAAKPASDDKPHHEQAPVVQPPETVSSHSVVNEAYHKANSHKEKFEPKVHRPKKSRRRGWLKPLIITAVVAVILAGLATGGWFIYQKSAVVDGRLAAWRAGFSVEVPAYTPAGFIFRAPIFYAHHQAIITYRGIGNSQYYKLEEVVSNWSTQTLLTKEVTNNNLSYQTFQAGGLYIYVYDSGNATWVSQGVWYTISGHNNISAKKLAEIAAST
jgi:hypothetical protein